jgi:uncharacterized protein YkwD
MALRSFFLGVVALALPLALAGCNGTTSCFCGPTPANPIDSDESSIVYDLNMSRASAGIMTPLKVCTSLNVSAAAHADDMRDNGYLSDVDPTTMSNVRTRGCAAGYTPACSGSIPMAELVAEGNGTGSQTYSQWAADPMAAPILTEASFEVVGLGHSIGSTNDYWVLDLAADMDASCN